MMIAQADAEHLADFGPAPRRPVQADEQPMRQALLLGDEGMHGAAVPGGMAQAGGTIGSSTQFSWSGPKWIVVVPP